MALDKIYFYDENLKDIKWLVHGFSTRRLKTSSSDKIDQIKDFAKILIGKDIPIYLGKQVHKDDVKLISNDTSGKPNDVRIFPHTDALVLSKKNAGICVLTADCLPILIADLKNEVVALVHSGWKGTLLDIVSKCVNKMIKLMDTDIENLKVWIAPAIGKCCYEVGEDVLSQYRSRFDFYDEIVDGNKLDLVKTVEFQLRKLGLRENQITSADICTKCNESLLFSHRANNDQNGRNILLAAILD